MQYPEIVSLGCNAAPNSNRRYSMRPQCSCNQSHINTPPRRRERALRSLALPERSPSRTWFAKPALNDKVQTTAVLVMSGLASATVTKRLRHLLVLRRQSTHEGFQRFDLLSHRLLEPLLGRKQPHRSRWIEEESGGDRKLCFLRENEESKKEGCRL